MLGESMDLQMNRSPWGFGKEKRKSNYGEATKFECGLPWRVETTSKLGQLLFIAPPRFVA